MDIGATGVGSAGVGLRRSLAVAPMRAGAGAGADTGTATGANPTDPESQREIARLKQRDAEVRQHEQAHVSAGGSFAGSPQYEFQRGPDGRQYAVGGEVQIDLSREKEPAATISKMETVKRAALAPAEPSPQDLRVAQQADQIKADAKSEQRKQAEKSDTGTGGTDGTKKRKPEEPGVEADAAPTATDEAQKDGAVAGTGTPPGTSNKGVSGSSANGGTGGNTGADQSGGRLASAPTAAIAARSAQVLTAFSAYHATAAYAARQPGVFSLHA